MEDLFQVEEEIKAVKPPPAASPLAARMRPRSLEELVGQEHILAPGKLLRRAIEADRPPGTGKTTLARVIAEMTQAKFVRLSGVESNVAVMRRVVAAAGNRIRHAGQKTRAFLPIVFLSAATPHAEAQLPALDWSITKYLGTTGAEEVMLNRITPSSGAHLGGIHIDTQRTPNRFYAFDSANNRILGFYGWRPPNPDGSFPPADIVIGQPAGWDFGAANRNNTQSLQPTAATLALLPFPFVNSTAEGGRSGTMATDTDGNLYVADLNNNRVLKFNDPFATDSIADEVWGQATLTTRAPLEPPSASSLNLAWEYGIFGAGVEIDPAGNLWVTDSGNHRVLRFPKQGATIAKTADRVIGQVNFTSNTSGTALDKLYKPQAVRVHPTTGELSVLDGESPNYGGPARLLVFAPPFTNGMSAIRELGKLTSDQASGLFNARGFVFDPHDAAAVWVSDGGNHRLLKLNTQSGAKLDVIGRPDFTLDSPPEYLRFDGQINELRQAEAEIAFDSAGRLHFTCLYGVSGIARIPFPLRRDAAGHVISDSEMLKRGWNTISGRTMQDHYGLAREGSQVYVRDGNRVLVWNNAAFTPTFAAADYAIGQESVDQSVIGGTFESHGIGNMHAAGGRLFVAGSDKIYIFATPITSGGRDYAPLKTITADTIDLTWNDDGSFVPFYCNGLVYDPGNNALWISDYPRNRILRVANPLSATPTVNLVLGQTTKEGSAQNHGLGLRNPDTTGVAAPWTLALDNFGNLYAVDSAFEGREDNAGNRRVLRFDAAALVPVAGNIFPNPAASGVFCKPTFTTNRDYYDSHRPNTPTHIAFDSQNRMILLCDSYGNEQGERAYLYPTPHIGTAPQPSQRLTTSFGQAAFAYFDNVDRLILQDHTWNRVLFYAPGATAPLVAISNAPATAAAGTTTVAIAGTCNANVTGMLTWKTDSGATGTVPANASWTISAVPLNSTGTTTVISVTGANSAGTRSSTARSVTREILSPPAIVPEGGTFVAPINVSALHFRSNVTVRYTLDGSDPTSSSPAFTAPFSMNASGTVKARAFLAEAPPSEVSTAVYDLLAATPTISPPGATFSNSVLVTLATATSGAQIRYTLDDIEPTASSTLYSAPASLDFSAVMKARAFRAGLTPSNVATAQFTRTGTPAAIPTISPPGGHRTGATVVTLACTTPGAQIRYTVDGRDVFGTAPLYTGPFTVNGSVIVKARAYASGFVPSAQARAVFHLRSAWSSSELPAGTPVRDRHTALGSDGAFLYFTAGNSANATFSRLPKGGSVWQTRASLPLPTNIDGSSGVGDLGFFGGSLYTHALHSNASLNRAVYRYDIAANTWVRGVPGLSDGVNGACVPRAANSILGGWLGWTRVMEVIDPLTGAANDVGDLSGNASGMWDGCAGATDTWFLKHHSTPENAGVLARLGHTGGSALIEVGAMPFNPGMGGALEVVPGKFFADGHERLFILRGGAGTSESDATDWTTDTTENQLAIYDVAANTWLTETLPFAIGEGSEMALVSDTLYVLAAANESSPLHWFRFLGSAPAVETLPADHINPDNAMLNASVNSRGAVATVWWEYGTTTNYGGATPTQFLPASFDASFPSANVTGLVPGTLYHCRVRATNSYGTTSGDDQTFTARSLTPIEQWRQTYFGSYLNTGAAADLADPDGDGLLNLAEYGLATNPTTPNIAALPMLGRDAGRLTFTFTRNLAATDLTLRILAADAIGGSWNALATKSGNAAWVLAPGATIDDPGTGPVTAHDAVPIAGRTKRFLRLEFSY